MWVLHRNNEAFMWIPLEHVVLIVVLTAGTMKTKHE